jgi:hypothetical protein
MKLLIKLRHLLEKDKSYHLKKYLEIDLASQQHFVEKRCPAFLKKKRLFNKKEEQKRLFNKKDEKKRRTVSFRRKLKLTGTIAL